MNTIIKRHRALISSLLIILGLILPLVVTNSAVPVWAASEGLWATAQTCTACTLTNPGNSIDGATNGFEFWKLDVIYGYPVVVIRTFAWPNMLRSLSSRARLGASRSSRVTRFHDSPLPSET